MRRMNSESRRSASVTRHLLLAADLLRGRTHDRHSLAARLGVRPAMADRLINAAVEQLPGVVEWRDGKQRKIRMDRTAVTPEPSYPTAVAACFGASLWPLFEGTSYQAGIRDAFRDVVGRTRRRAVFRDIDRKFWFLARGGEVALLDRAPLLDEVIEAVLHHRVLSVEYTRFSGRPERLRLEPLSIVVHDHQLYVVARSDGATLHPYRFARIHAVDVLDDTFTYPNRTEYDPQQVFRDSFGIFLDLPVQDVELRLDKQWATYAQTHRWHDSQVVEVVDGQVRVQLRVRVCPELEAWILGFGEQAEVISPAKLRERIASRVSAADHAYRTGRVAPGPTLRKATRPDPSSDRRRPKARA
jgi:predicted DNA-binding transcriptional regulator YafY